MSKLPEQTTLHDQNPPLSANGSPFPSQPGKAAGPRALPSHTAGRSYRGVLIAVFCLLLAAGADVGAHFLVGKSLVSKHLFGPGTDDRNDVILHTVKKEPLIVTVTAKGQIESAANKDIVCQVRAGSKGFATTIKWVIEDGARVKPGQLLMELDDSALKDQEAAQSITVQEKMALKVKAEKDYEIAIKENENALTLAEIELDKLTGIAPDPGLRGLAALAGMPTSLVEGGTYKQDLDDITGQISMAQATVEQNRERAAWADRMVLLTYMSPAQAQAEKSRLDSSIEDLRSKTVKKALLISHDRKQRITDLTSKRDQARLKAEATEISSRIAKQTATSIYEQAEDTLADIRRQSAECKIKAPDNIVEGSMVVYFKPEGNRFGQSSAQGMIEQGAQVKEGQKMLRIPNLKEMQVNAKVNEAMVTRIKGEVRVPTRLAESVFATWFVNPDLFGRAAATRPGVLEGMHERFRHHESRKIADGQRTIIKLNSLADKQFVGHVKTVALVASQADFMQSDVKMYQTFVRIDGELAPDGKTIPIEGEILKPDMTAVVVISVDAAKGPVLTAPIQAVIGGTEMGDTREVFVKTATGYERRQVKLGLYNETMVEIREGLVEGDVIVSNPKLLLGETDKTKTREPGEFKNDSKGGNGDGKGFDKSGIPGGGDPTKKGGNRGKQGGGFPPGEGGFPKGGPGGPGGGGPQAGV
jgi:HlyD family secretion protein